MSTIERTLDLDLAALRPARRPIAARAWNVVASVYRAIRNRIIVTKMTDLDDHMLQDIGIDRRDVHRALATTDLFNDPSGYLTRQARARARRSIVYLPRD
ncbi:DUF1127 domain-containing protein [Rhizobium sp. PAMB 3182]